MAKQSTRGRSIISAGELGAYTVCPEAWRLQAVKNKKGTFVRSMAEGQTLHETWARKYDEAVFLAREAKLFVMLLFVTVMLIVVLVIG
jgi:hypothetical protein